MWLLFDDGGCRTAQELTGMQIWGGDNGRVLFTLNVDGEEKLMEVGDEEIPARVTSSAGELNKWLSGVAVI